ncbi:MAG: hypothetical protein JWQ97_996 [Phenylobacterium sp.]|nr:hypothetical protein [Phenylobacterium sp.]
MAEPFFCPVCELTHPHHHEQRTAPNGDLREVIIHHPEDPRAEVREPDTGEVIFPAVKGPLRVIEGGKATEPKDSPHEG